MTYTHVFRFTSPPGRKGARCRIVSNGVRRFWPDGALVMNSGDNTVALEFEDGTRITAVRSSVVLATSRLGRQTIVRVARGDLSPDKARRLEARKDQRARRTSRQDIRCGAIPRGLIQSPPDTVHMKP